jgi:hypothetical protein
LQVRVLSGSFWKAPHFLGQWHVEIEIFPMTRLTGVGIILSLDASLVSGWSCCSIATQLSFKMSGIARNALQNHLYIFGFWQNEAREIRTPNLLIWSQTRCRCAIAPLIANSSIACLAQCIHSEQIIGTHHSNARHEDSFPMVSRFLCWAPYPMSAARSWRRLFQRFLLLAGRPNNYNTGTQDRTGDLQRVRLTS